MDYWRLALCLVVLLVAWLATGRMGTRYANLKPLRWPAVLTLGAGSALAVSHRLPAGGLSLLLLVPMLVLVVRCVVLALGGLFFHSQKQRPSRLLENIVSASLYGVGITAIARYSFAVQLTPFLATSAVLGAVVGLALQDTLGNLFSGIALHTEAPFRVGDWIRLGEREGRVEQVSWRATRLRTWYGDTLTVPNNDVARQAILNYSQPPEPHQRTVAIGVSLTHPPGQVLQALEQLLAAVPGLPQDPPAHARILGYRESAVEYEITYATPRYEDYRRIEGEIQRLLWYRFMREGIQIPFPTRTVLLRRPHDDALQGALLGRLESLLRSIDLFRPLVDGELHFAATRFRHVWFGAGETIIEQATPGDSFFVIDRGVVEIHVRRAGVPRAVAELGEGQFFGEMALLTGQRRTATVVAKSDAELFTIDKAGFHDILAAKPGIAEEISLMLATRREALSQAADEAAQEDEDSAAAPGDLRQRLLDRIRGYFGL